MMKSPWDIYIYGKPFTGDQGILNGKIFAEKDSLLSALHLKIDLFLPADQWARQNGKSFVWFPAVVKLTSASLLINSETHIIDVAVIKGIPPGMPIPTPEASPTPGASPPSEGSGTSTEEKSSAPKSSPEGSEGKSD